MFEDLADGVAMALPYSINVHKLQWAEPRLDCKVVDHHPVEHSVVKQ